MDTIAIIAQKGGTGKTTTAQALAAGLKNRGARVLLIDADPQGNLTYAMGAETARANLYSVLLEETTAQEATQTIGGIGLITASPLLATLDLTLTQARREYRLKGALNSITVHFDYCIIDTPPALGIITTNALTASNRAIITAQADIFSLQGIGALLPIFQAIRSHTNPGLDIDGILLTRYNPRTIISREIMTMLEETAKRMHTKVFHTTIRENTAIKEAQATRQDIYTYDSNSNAASDYRGFIDELMRGRANNG